METDEGKYWYNSTTEDTTWDDPHNSKKRPVSTVVNIKGKLKQQQSRRF